jgi:hypothetical protein
VGRVSTTPGTPGAAQQQPNVGQAPLASAARTPDASGRAPASTPGSADTRETSPGVAGRAPNDTARSPSGAQDSPGMAPRDTGQAAPSTGRGQTASPTSPGGTTASQPGQQPDATLVAEVLDSVAQTAPLMAEPAVVSSLLSGAAANNTLQVVNLSDRLNGDRSSFLQRVISQSEVIEEQRARLDAVIRDSSGLQEYLSRHNADPDRVMAIALDVGSDSQSASVDRGARAGTGTMPGTTGSAGTMPGTTGSTGTMPGTSASRSPDSATAPSAGMPGTTAGRDSADRTTPGASAPGRASDSGSVSSQTIASPTVTLYVMNRS